MLSLSLPKAGIKKRGSVHCESLTDVVKRMTQGEGRLAVPHGLDGGEGRESVPPGVEGPRKG